MDNVLIDDRRIHVDFSQEQFSIKNIDESSETRSTAAIRLAIDGGPIILFLIDGEANQSSKNLIT